MRHKSVSSRAQVCDDHRCAQACAAIMCATQLQASDLVLLYWLETGIGRVRDEICSLHPLHRQEVSPLMTATSTKDLRCMTAYPMPDLAGATLPAMTHNRCLPHGAGAIVEGQC